MTRTLPLLAVAAMWTAPALAGPPFTLTWSTLDAGGGTSTAGDLSLTGSIGQPDTTVLTAPDTTLAGGFLPAAATAAPPCPADVTGDGTVDIADLNLVLSNFNSATTDGDATGDGQVDIADLNAVLVAFNTACPT